MLDLLCDDVLQLICKDFEPSQLLWLMCTCKRVKDVVVSIVNRRLNELTLVMDGNVGPTAVLPLFKCDMRGKVLYYINYRSGYDREFIKQLNLIISWNGVIRAPKNHYELDKVVKFQKENRLVILLYQSYDDVKGVIAMYNVDYICYGELFPTYRLPPSDDIRNDVHNLMKNMEHIYGHKIQLVYDIKKKKFHYLDFSKFDV